MQKKDKIETYPIIIIGGGASGFFSAIRIKELLNKHNIESDVCILEGQKNFLNKVKISGGGRCNVTHNCRDLRSFCQNYPRGQKELLSPMTIFGPTQTIDWFEKRSVSLLEENDGRIFPKTHDSQTIIDCLIKEAHAKGVQLLGKHLVESIKLNSESYLVKIKNRDPIVVRSIILSTGDSRIGYEIAKNLGHTINSLTPSLFTFLISHPLLKDLSGLVLENCLIKLKKCSSKNFYLRGPLLITHKGLSGPVILKLSALAARELKNINYEDILIINWVNESENILKENLFNYKKTNTGQNLSKHPFSFPKRFWQRVLCLLGISPSRKWGELSNEDLNRLLSLLVKSEFSIKGINKFKEEFVTCGGVSLKEVNMKTLESKITSNFYFTGEVLDIDGLTGGFNLQNAWTTGYCAGTACAKKLINSFE